MIHAFEVSVHVVAQKNQCFCWKWHLEKVLMSSCVHLPLKRKEISSLWLCWIVRDLECICLHLPDTNIAKPWVILRCYNAPTLLWILWAVLALAQPRQCEITEASKSARDAYMRVWTQEPWLIMCVARIRLSFKIKLRIGLRLLLGWELALDLMMMMWWKITHVRQNTCQAELLMRVCHSLKWIILHPPWFIYTHSKQYHPQPAVMI